MEENLMKVKEELFAANQPSFEVRNFRENRPTYAIDGKMEEET